MKTLGRIRLPLLALSIAVSCVSRDAGDPAMDVAFLTGSTHPMVLASGIQLGMTARTLKTLRPKARPAPYSGYSEQVGDYRIMYGIPGSFSDMQVVPDGNRITSVSVELLSHSDSVVTAIWEESIRTLTASLPRNARCVRTEGTAVREGRARLWKTDSVYVTAMALKKDPRLEPSARFYVFVGTSPSTGLLQASKPCPDEGVFR